VAKVVVACDKFKGSLTALEACAAVAAGLTARRQADVVELPIADGGEGTVAAALHAGFAPCEVAATGPTGEPMLATYARQGDLAVVELAEVCGFARLSGGQLAPMTASSRGIGEVVAAAIDGGCRRIILGVGGSVSTDGGAGMVQALGARVLDARGCEVAPGGAALATVASVELPTLHRRLSGVTIALACDVDNPLLGKTGAATVYGAQKGASPAQVTELGIALGRWADVVATATGTDRRSTPGSGAAGGVGFAAVALLGADVRPGIEVLLELVDFAGIVRSADLVVTGEGSFDEQTLRGKAPTGVASAAAAWGVPVVVACGRSLLDEEAFHAAGIKAVYSCEELEPDMRSSMANAADLLARIGHTIAQEHLGGAADPVTPAASRIRR
jgi:glycerate 2-kinase